MTEAAKIVPDQQDYDEVEREYGAPKSNSDADLAERYRLAQIAKLIRLHVHDQPDAKPSLSIVRDDDD